MKRCKTSTLILIPFLFAFVLGACQGKTDSEPYPTLIVDPPAVPTSSGPIVMEVDELILATIFAVEQGDKDFWTLAGNSYYPALHQSYTSVDDFVSQMDQTTKAYDFQCRSVQRYPWLNYYGGVEGDLLSIVFTASGNEFYDESGVLSPEMGVFEVSFLIGDNDDIFHLQSTGFPASSGETLEELYQNSISYREERMGQSNKELQIEPCPNLE